MEIRKIQITGGSTHVISLPKKWVDRNGLGRSDTLAIHEESDDSLLVIPHGEVAPRLRRITIDIQDGRSQEELVRRLIGSYLAGADEIHLRTAGRMDPKVRQWVRDIIRDLVGVEILEEGSNFVTLQDLVGVSDMDLRKTVTRMHRIARLMFDDALAAFSENNAELAGDVISRDDELDRLEWHVSKQMHALLETPRLAARLQIRPAEALNMFLVARTVERMGDHASKICKELSRALAPIPQELTESVLAQAQSVCDLWDEAFASIKKNDFAQASRAVDSGKAAAHWRAGFGGLLQTHSPELVAPMTLIADSVDRVRSYAIDISEIAMNQSLQRLVSEAK